ncbi:MAG TPA: sn-glycerol-3-phosphate ABC transporter ATP-binding protein UgpC [Terriglobales bacterium]|nr:sn-glycerol-3-phosphate ABC transporter ATP-binding protein UgpC [Terriglobales bacterium]
MHKLELKAVSKHFDKNQVLRDISFEVEEGEFFVLVGPSGCGKSTILRLIVGLEEVSTGEIYLDGLLINNLPAKQRDMAMVFQNYALYPHFTVFENLAFPLKLRGYSKEEISLRVNETAEILGLEKLLQRKPKVLSGGERQRVALGRAIVRKPKLFLFDEPLSNLDALLRVQMRGELLKLHKRLKSSVVYVTHDQLEAMTLGNRCLVLKEGTIQQTGTPFELYRSPSNIFVASFIGTPSINLLKGVLTPALEFKLSDKYGFSLPEKFEQRLKRFSGSEICLGIRPEDVRISSEKRNPKFELEQIEPVGAEAFLYFKVGDQKLVTRERGYENLKPGFCLELSFNLDKAVFFDLKTGENIFKDLKSK